MTTRIARSIYFGQNVQSLEWKQFDKFQLFQLRIKKSIFIWNIRQLLCLKRKFNFFFSFHFYFHFRGVGGSNLGVVKSFFSAISFTIDKKRIKWHLCNCQEEERNGWRFGWHQNLNWGLGRRLLHPNTSPQGQKSGPISGWNHF